MADLNNLESTSTVDVAKIPLALYIHIPWCERKCPYCDFNSHENFDHALEEPYIDALLSDLAIQLGEGTPSATLSSDCRVQPHKLVAAVGQRPLTSIFIGGGTPSLFSGRAIGRLLEGIDQLLGIGDAEVTLESNPGSAEARRYADYRAGGVNRLSIGIQSFDEASLRQLGRVHNSDQARAAVQLAAKHFKRFNLDLMHGLPGQTPAMAEADLQQAILMSRGHISWYQLTIEPNTAFWSKPPEIPVEDALADIQDLGEALLVTAGFEQYEVSAWSRPGEASRHNLNYWTFGDYIGIGAGAHGKLTTADGTLTRTQRTRLPKDYLAAVADRKPPRTNAVARQEIAGEFMLNALRLREGVPATMLSAHTGLGLSELEPVWSGLRRRGLMVDDDSRLQTTATGFRFLNEIVSEFLESAR